MLSKDFVFANSQLIFGGHVANSTTQTLVIIAPYKPINPQASASESGVPGRMHSVFSDLFYRSNFPSLCE